MYLFKKIFFLILISLTITCQTNREREILIMGDIKNFPYPKVYLAEAHDWQKPIREVDVVNGKFSIEISVPATYVPVFMGSIGYKDSTHKIKLLEFKNSVLSPNEVKYVYSSFILDDTTIQINGDFEKSKYVNISAGNETKALYRTQMMDFGFLSPNDSLRIDKIDTFKKVIKENNSSFFLLKCIADNKSMYSNNELESIVSCFSKNLRNAEYARQISNYMLERPDRNKRKENIKLLNIYGDSSEVYDTKSKVNMIVFWASWCAPCRKEIPEIKDLYKKYYKKGLSITSVSIDDNIDNWKKALQFEKMEWNQLILPEHSKDRFNKEYEVASIPDVVFLNHEGHIIQRFIGYDSSQIKSFEAILNKELSMER